MSTEVNQRLLTQANKLGYQNEVHAWLEAKKIKPTDLVFLAPLSNDLQWQLFFKSLMLVIEFRSTYSESIKLLEVISDLILMGHEEALFENSHDYALWCEHIKKLRYPTTSQRDDLLKNKFEKLPWPFGAKTKFERRGDRAGIELKLFITSEADLIKIISSLERVKEKLNENQ